MSGQSPAPATTTPAAGPVRRRAAAGALAPVVDALWASARARAGALRLAAEGEARAELARGAEEAARILAEARAEGARAAEQRAALQLAAARRAAREAVLAAQRDAYEALRRRALADLAAHGAAPEGRQLAERLEALVRERLGPGASVRRTGPGALGAVATSGDRRAEIGPAELVDAALDALAAEVEGLWA